MPRAKPMCPNFIADTGYFGSLPSLGTVSERRHLDWESAGDNDKTSKNLSPESMQVNQDEPCVTVTCRVLSLQYCFTCCKRHRQQPTYSRRAQIHRYKRPLRNLINLHDSISRRNSVSIVELHGKLLRPRVYTCPWF